MSAIAERLDWNGGQFLMVTNGGDLELQIKDCA